MFSFRILLRIENLNWYCEKKNYKIFTKKSTFVKIKKNQKPTCVIIILFCLKYFLKSFLIFEMHLFRKMSQY